MNVTIEDWHDGDELAIIPHPEMRALLRPIVGPSCVAVYEVFVEQRARTMTVDDLANSLGVSPTLLTHTLERLKGFRFVDRTDDGVRLRARPVRSLLERQLRRRWEQDRLPLDLFAMARRRGLLAPSAESIPASSST